MPVPGLRQVGRGVKWANASTGRKRQLGKYVNWANASTGQMRRLGKCVNWANASSGRKRQLGRGVNWANASTGQARQVGREGVYDQSKRELISFLEKLMWRESCIMLKDEARLSSRDPIRQVTYSNSSGYLYNSKPFVPIYIAVVWYISGKS